MQVFCCWKVAKRTSHWQLAGHSVTMWLSGRMSNSSYDRCQLDVTTKFLLLSVARIAIDFLVEGSAPGHDARCSKTRVILANRDRARIKSEPKGNKRLPEPS